MYILLVVIIVILVYVIITQNKKQKQNVVIVPPDVSELQRQFDSLTKECEGLKRLKEETEKSVLVLKTQRESLEQSYAEREKSLESTLQARTASIDANLKAHFTAQEAKYRDDLEYVLLDISNAAAEEFSIADVERRQKLNSLQEQITQEQALLSDYQQKRQVINDEILRQRAINEQVEFFKIGIDDESKEDISVLSSIRLQLHKREYLDKMIYDNYVAKPLAEMSKRVLNGRSPSGIYKITNIQTNEIYVGRSSDIRTRWANHIKSACGLEGVADSQFQRALKKYGIENFTFELLEEVPKEKLSEREKYYIQFYDTTKYGYNQRIG